MSKSLSLKEARQILQMGRPKAVIFIGNGFTIGLSDYLGIRHWHDTTKIFPAPYWIQEISSKTHSRNQTLWSEDRYPSLWKAWHEINSSTNITSNSSFHQFSEYIMRYGKPFDLLQREDRTPYLVYYPQHIGYEMRRYLWYLFHYLNNRLIHEITKISPWAKSESPNKYYQALNRATSEWQMVRTLTKLAKVWNLTLISFNYESYLENILESHEVRQYNLRERGNNDPTQLPIGSFVVLHPHGELATHKSTNINNRKPINDAIINVKNARLRISYNLNEPGFEDYFFPSKLPCPDFPDLVPPGHSEEHLMSKFSYYQGFISEKIASANIIGTIGFSGTSPDDQEFKNYLVRASSDISTFSIGLKSTFSDLQSSIILSELSSGQKHLLFDVNDLADFDLWVDDTFIKVFPQRLIPKIGKNVVDFSELFQLALNKINDKDSKSIDNILLQFAFFKEKGTHGITEFVNSYLQAEKKRHNCEAVQARELYYSALTFLMKQHQVPPTLFSHLYNKLSETYIIEGNSDMAGEMVIESLRYSKELQDERTHAETFSCMGKIAQLEENYELAAEAFSHSYEYYVGLNEFSNAYQALLEKANAYVGLNRIEDAETIYLELRDIALKGINQEFLGVVHAALGQLFRFKSYKPPRQNAEIHLVTATEYYQSSITLLQNHAWELCMATLGLAMVFMDLKNYNKAKELLDENLKICIKANFQKGEELTKKIIKQLPKEWLE